MSEEAKNLIGSKVIMFNSPDGKDAIVLKGDNMHKEPELIESSDEYEVWGCNGKKLVHEKRYSLALKRYACGTYRFNDDYYIVNQNSYNVMYTVNGVRYYTRDYISLMEWCTQVGFYTKE